MLIEGSSKIVCPSRLDSAGTDDESTTITKRRTELWRLKQALFSGECQKEMRCVLGFDRRCRYNNSETSVRHTHSDGNSDTASWVRVAVTGHRKYASVLARFVLSFTCSIWFRAKGVFLESNASRSSLRVDSIVRRAHNGRPESGA